MGWCIQGRRENINNSLNILFSNCREEDDLNECLKKFWELEDVNSVKQITASNEIVEKFWDSITFLPDKNQYICNLLWKPEKKHLLASNYQQAYKRLHQNINKLKRDNELFFDYNEKIMEYVHLGFASKVPTVT